MGSILKHSWYQNYLYYTFCLMIRYEMKDLVHRFKTNDTCIDQISIMVTEEDIQAGMSDRYLISLILNYLEPTQILWKPSKIGYPLS
jgi:hypothetical protein